MFGKIISFIYFVGISNAVFIDTAENHNKDLDKTNPHAWQTVKMYHPPAQTFGYKYEPYAYPKYEFEYSVSDKKTGDQKHHRESRDGDRVRGEYSLVDSDGSLRKVQYHADDYNGFNAVVSKTINKHGDNAVSVTDHTRFFYPVGHNVKINHYFPGKEYHYQKLENNKISKPVYEESSITNNDDNKMVLIESGDKLIVVEPVKIVEQTHDSAPLEEVPTPKSEGAEAVQVVPGIVSVVPNIPEEGKISTEVDTSESSIQKTEPVVLNELSPEREDQKIEKDEPSDSDVASSYYHSKVYYISY